MSFTGKVERKPFAAGSKSEHDAVMLVTEEGEYVLRRKGGNPFRDAILDQLVGKTIVCEGNLHGYTLTMSEWKEI